MIPGQALSGADNGGGGGFFHDQGALGGSAANPANSNLPRCCINPKRTKKSPDYGYTIRWSGDLLLCKAGNIY